MLKSRCFRVFVLSYYFIIGLLYVEVGRFFKGLWGSFLFLGEKMEFWREGVV